jgi:hypothetical protein
MSTKKPISMHKSKRVSTIKHTSSKLPIESSDKVLEEIQQALIKAESETDDVEKLIEKNMKKPLSEKKHKMMYPMNGKKSKKRNMYHYYYQNPFGLILRRKALLGLPKIFDEKLFSMIISLTLFQTKDQSSIESNLILAGMTILFLPHSLFWSLIHKLYLFGKLPYAIYAKIRTKGLGNKVENLFKTIINDIYSNDKYILLQQVADSNSSTNREEPFAGDKNKKFSIEFVSKLASLFIYLSLRQLDINGKTYGTREDIDLISLSQPIHLIKDHLLNIYNEDTKDDILTWFQDNYTFIAIGINITLPILTLTQNINYGMTSQNMIVQQQQFNQALTKLSPYEIRKIMQQNRLNGTQGMINPTLQMAQPLMMGPIVTTNPSIPI